VQAQRTLSSRHLSWVFKGAFILLFIYFLTRANLHTILASLLAATPWPLILSLLILVPFIWAKSMRWGVILRGMGAQPPGEIRLFIYYTIGLFLGGVTPGQFGDIAKGWYLRADHVPLKTAMTSVVIDRVCDMLIMALLGMAALTDYVGLVAPELLLSAQAGTLILAGASGLLVSERFRRWLAGLLDREPLRKLRISRLLDFQFSLFSDSWLTLLIFTLLSIGLNLLRGWLLFVALGLNIPLFSVFAAITLIAIFQVLPVSIAGFGVREAILIITLQHYGYSIESALSLSLLLLLLNIQQIGIGFLVSLFFPIPAENNE
jgi:uncharacterized protein (TIRG00374 family)